MTYVEEFSRAGLWLASGGLLMLMGVFARLDADRYQGRHVAVRQSVTTLAA